MEPSRAYVYKEVGSGVLSDIFVTWVEPLSNLRTPICLQKRQNLLAWHKQEIELIVENVSSSLLPSLASRHFFPRVYPGSFLYEKEPGYEATCNLLNFTAFLILSAAWH